MGSRRFKIFLGVSIFSIIIYCNKSVLPDRPKIPFPKVSYGSKNSNSTDPLNALALPHDYDEKPVGDEYCEERYGLSFMEPFRDSLNAYCDPVTSASTMECLHTRVNPNHHDPFCILNNVMLDRQGGNHSFTLDCNLRNFTADPGKNEPKDLYSFHKYMFGEGPRAAFVNHFIHTNTTNPMPDKTLKALSTCKSGSKSKNWKIVINRDAHGGRHPWHSLMEIFSMYITLDIMRSTARPLDGKPFFSPEDIPDTQVIITDSHPDHNLYELWNLLGFKSVMRLPDYLASENATCLDNVLFPLAGGSNTMWHGDWRLKDCRNSRFLDIFIDRIMGHYGIDHTRKSDGPIVVTFIDRRGRRKFRDQAKHVKRFQENFPNVKVNVVDFADIPYSEQIRIVAKSDILAGIHGAALTHAMYLPPQSSVVEIQPYKLKHRGFRNLAKLLGHRYFNTHCFEDPTADPNWHKVTDIAIEDEKFDDVMKAAVWSVYNSRTLGIDIS
ncbi:glycosyltransferase family 61 protein [Patellaria atrata CBS 101060]|uniref:EGF domain-specific O-linked N-acetylglucosamine transferase n=1 Tax=Patellaria atrata CBS 101060 TaxID=1346257 RepID=A0A9P4VJR5_9PEZI|nr:glycosyltransferase family 61 protein [Patellaria atrata CBS 101060]